MSLNAKLLALAAAGFLAAMPSLGGARADHLDNERRAHDGDGRLVVVYETGQWRGDGRYYRPHRHGRNFGDQGFHQHWRGHKHKHKHARAHRRHHRWRGHGDGYAWGYDQRPYYGNDDRVYRVSCRTEYLSGKRNHRRALFQHRVCVDRRGFSFVVANSRQFVGFIAQ